MQLLRDYAAGCDAETLLTELAHGASAIAQLVPELADRWPDLLPLPPLDADRAGERALAMLAYEEAADRFRGALDAIALEPPVDPRRRGELLLALARAQMAAGQSGAARTAFEQAAALARAIGASDPLARAALGVVREFTEPAHDPRLARDPVFRATRGTRCRHCNAVCNRDPTPDPSLTSLGNNVARRMRLA